ncbi:hypothetical protein NECID01_0887 [Nematocida sp. AWRm77]|nr:hypothetical protein NECID01_0887 [Nematocida sp. AWRm77]
MEWLYEAIDMHISVETNSGRLVKGTLKDIDQRKNLLVVTHSEEVLIPSTEVSTVVLPSSLVHLLRARRCLG